MRLCDATLRDKKQNEKYISIYPLYPILHIPYITKPISAFTTNTSLLICKIRIGCFIPCPTSAQFHTSVRFKSHKLQCVHEITSYALKVFFKKYIEVMPMQNKMTRLFLVVLFILLLSACPGNEEKLPENRVENDPGDLQPLPQQIPPSGTPVPTVPEKNPNEISSYSTEILNKDEDRVHNIKKAAEELNHTVVEPGETFSFNSVLGKRTKEKGYEEAPILLGNGEEGEGVGGGICQISSTLYNAVLQTNMKVVERHHHSEAVPYVPEGKDATVVYNCKDFRFKNTKDYPVEILVWVSEDEVTVKLLKKVNP